MNYVYSLNLGIFISLLCVQSDYFPNSCTLYIKWYSKLYRFAIIIELWLFNTLHYYSSVPSLRIWSIWVNGRTHDCNVFHCKKENKPHRTICVFVIYSGHDFPKFGSMVKSKISGNTQSYVYTMAATYTCVYSKLN